MKHLVIAGALILACGDSGRVETPAFAVAVIVEPSATARLRAVGETVAVAVIFEGTAHQFPDALGTVRVALPATGGVASIPAREFAAALEERFASVTINVTSARKMLATNVVACDAPTIPDRTVHTAAAAAERSHRELAGVTVTVRCR
jgi:hypothetical protein